MIREYKPSVPEVLPAVRALYALPGGEAGCCLHIVLDDGNVHDADVEFCIWIAVGEKHPGCERLARALRSMSRTQRLKLVALKHGSAHDSHSAAGASGARGA